MVGHKHALERAQKRDEKGSKKKKGGWTFEPRKTITFFGDLNVPLLRADTSIGGEKGQQLTDYRAIEKGG